MSNNENIEDDFVVWLDSQEADFGITDYELSKQGGFSHSVLSRARTGIPPKWDVCVSIAKVFKLSPITVFRKARLLPPGPDDEVNLDNWEHLLAQMTAEEREEVRDISVMKIDRRQKSEQSARAVKFKEGKVKK